MHHVDQVSLIRMLARSSHERLLLPWRQCPCEISWTTVFHWLFSYFDRQSGNKKANAFTAFRHYSTGDFIETFACGYLQNLGQLSRAEQLTELTDSTFLASIFGSDTHRLYRGS